MTGSPPPRSREALLRIAGPYRRKIFDMVRGILDDLEDAAPWDSLYYPPEASGPFVAMVSSLLDEIRGIPERVQRLIDSFPDEESADPASLAPGDTRFFFEGIHMMVGPELARLDARLAQLREATEVPEEERELVCELAADLKGKYSSALMGAAASLIGEGRWGGVEIEPILFPEKAAEFERNELLVETLEEVLGALRQLPQEVPLPKLVARWREERRVDQYALTPFYAFLNQLGQLMKESSRRALYSGDYHQIKKRERMLAARVNELNLLHGRSWEGTSPGIEGLYEQLVQKSMEIAAIVDVDMLREIVGQGRVRSLLGMVETGGRGSGNLARPLPPEAAQLVPLLAEEDLRTFFELLLGSVLKRASLAGRRKPAAAAAVAEPAPTIDGSALLPELPEELFPVAADPPPAPLAAPPPDTAGSPPLAPAPFAPVLSLEERLRTVAALRQSLESLTSTTNAERKAFDFFHRFLGRNRAVPPGMLRTIHPYLSTVRETLLPLLDTVVAGGDLPEQTLQQLAECCAALQDPAIDPDAIRDRVPRHMERMGRLLDGLNATTGALLERLEAADPRPRS